MGLTGQHLHGTRSRNAFLILSLGLLLSTSAGGVAAAEAEGDGGERARIEVVNGKRFKMAKAKVADRVIRIGDAIGDQRTAEGVPAPEAAPFTDLAAAYLARIRVPPKLVDRMRRDYPLGTAGAFQGADAAWSKGDPAAFVAVELVERRPADAFGQQVEVGFDGPDVHPVQAGALDDPRRGIARFSLDGRFANGTYGSGTTDLSGWQPGSPIDFYNARAGNTGYYEQRTGRYFLIAPIPRGASSVAVTLRTESEEGEIVDRLELPAGGTFIDLEDPSGGYDPGTGEPTLGCRSVEIRALEGDPEGTAEGSVGEGSAGTLVTIVVGATDEAAFESQIVEPLEGRDRIDVRVHPSDAEDEPIIVPADVRLAPAVDAAIFRLTLPDGRWAIEPGEDEGAPRTPAGEALLDLRSLTGRGGLAVGGVPGGLVAGDTRCGRWAVPDDACQLVPEAALARLVGLEPDAIMRSTLVRPDGRSWCVGVDDATGGPKYLVRIGTAHTSGEDFAREVESQACPAVPLELGAEAAILDCAEENFESYLIRILPRERSGLDADAGLLVTVDLVVDPSRPFGERYDSELARETFASLADAVAVAARPARSAELPSSRDEGLAGEDEADADAVGDAGTDATDGSDAGHSPDPQPGG